VLALGIAHGVTQNATVTLHLQRLVADILMLARALPIWCLLLLPIMALPERCRNWLLWALSGLLIVAVVALDLYFSVSGVPLGADLFAYSLDEVRTTVSGAQWPVPWIALAIVLSALLVLLKVIWRPFRSKRWHITAAMSLLGLCLIASFALPARWPQADAKGAFAASNKVVLMIGDVLTYLKAHDEQNINAYPFQHPEATPDTLGPWLALDSKTPPNLLFVLVEGLGRSFSGPGARLGSFTPFLDSLAKRSLYWENFLATQGRTFAVLPSVLGSLPFGPYGEHRVDHDSLPSLLKSQGYQLRYFSGSDLAFDHQGAMLQAMGVDRLWSTSDYKAPAQKLSEWGYPDGDLMDAVLAQAWPRGPSVTVVQTMSMHTPFVVPRMSYWRQQALVRTRDLGLNGEQREEVMRQLDIYASILYTDNALQIFFERLAQLQAWKNTIVIITGDHRLPEIAMDTRIERYHVPLLIHSPLLREPRQIKALSSHADIAPTLLAMLSHQYGWATPQQVHWMGQGLDLHAQWRNLHNVVLKQTKTDLSDLISGEFYLAQDRLMTLQDGLIVTPEENPAVLQAMRQELAKIRASLPRIQQQGALVSEAGRQQLSFYEKTVRSLESAHRARKIEGLVITDVLGRFEVDQRLAVQGQITQHGQQNSPVFVPLLVISDAQGRELAEVSGKAIQLKAGESQQLQLQLPARDWPVGTYYLSLIVSHPDTGRPIGKGRYHVAVVR
jgi:phosphoglycerol transferase MdoB-like AlkP superfamily enzyme